MSPRPRIFSVQRLVAAGVLDADLAALAWLLLEDGVPVHVAGNEQWSRMDLLDALVAALPAGAIRRAGASAASLLDQVCSRHSLAVSTPAGLLRAALSGTTGRSGLASAIEGADLADVLAVLRGQGISDDEISFLGVVLVLGPAAGLGDRVPGRGHRVVAAHYLRPIARDVGGHVQRPGPAVLATWDPGRSEYDHFAWGIYPELAARTGRRAGDLEREHRRQPRVVQLELLRPRMQLDPARPGIERPSCLLDRRLVQVEPHERDAHGCTARTTPT